MSKTGTSSPSEWSEKNKTPILCLIDKDYENAKKAFDTINRKTPSEVEIESALDYLSSADIFDRLMDENSRVLSFKEKIIGESAILISDVEQAKKILSERMMCSVYEWYPNPRTTEFLNQYAEKLYQTTGYEGALIKIESMDDATLKNYLKRLVRENFKVGMEIMKDL